MRPASTFGVLLALLAAPLLADTFTGKVVGVTDGGTTREEAAPVALGRLLVRCQSGPASVCLLNRSGAG